jgi:tRNA-dihydrouridine synthase B
MKLGSSELGRIFLAPLSGVADSPFRRICKRFGADTVYTEMVSAQGLSRGNKRTAEVFRFDEEERPIGVQLFGSDPGRMAESAAIVSASRPDFVDINFACPARKIVSKGAGCALMRDPVAIGRITRAVVDATDIPVTAKIRLGWDAESLNAGPVVSVLEASGAGGVAIHGRTWKQGFKGRASWVDVARIKRESWIPVILSGDILSPADAVRALDETGCDAVMVARGACGRPWIFRSIQRLLGGATPAEPAMAEKVSVVLGHLDLVIDRYGEKLGAVRFRKHLLWYTKGMHGVVALRPAMSHVESRREIVDILSRLEKTNTGDPEWTARRS